MDGYLKKQPLYIYIYARARCARTHTHTHTHTRTHEPRYEDFVAATAVGGAYECDYCPCYPATW